MKSARVSRYACLALAGLMLAVPMHGQAQPVITVPPTNKTVRVGETAFFTVTASGTQPLTYQWRKDGVDIRGATGATLALGLARLDMGDNYSVVARNPSGSVTSAPLAELIVLPQEVNHGASVLAWGDNAYDQTSVPPAAQSGVMAIAAGWIHSVALKHDGSVVV